jgi:hypothetical protein
MTTDAFALLVAIAVPIIALLAVRGLIVDIRALERSRDELIELGITRR